MSKIMNFALVIHNHQPVDNDNAVIESVYRKSYLPFLKCLSEYPQIKVNVHYSGYLLEWLERHHHGFIRLLEKMVRRGQVEIVGGGYYEPVLATIPDRDALGQIALLNDKIEALLGFKVRGLWMAERAWEPESPEILARSGIKYTILDDTIFRLAGLSEHDCFHPYLVESRGAFVAVFPLLKTLRYLIPFKDASRTISYLRKSLKSNDAESVAVFADDGEKLGAWPTTYEEVYTRGWLRTFFGLLIKNQPWLKTVTLSEHLSTVKLEKRIYLPSASYQELMEWSLPANAKHVGRERGAGGFWRLFLSKYPESGRLYAKMLSVSNTVGRLKDGAGIKREMLLELWKAQFNDVYWHGIFGGLYFPKFRRVAYHHLIKAQSLIDPVLHKSDGGSWLSIEKSDSENQLGIDSISVNTKSLGLTVSPLLGGSLTEIDFKPAALNLTDVLSRRYETYHNKIVNLQRTKLKERKEEKGVRSIHELIETKEQGLQHLLVYDRYPKTSFLDYILKADTEIENFRDQNFVELADFAGHAYDSKIIYPKRVDSLGKNQIDTASLILSRVAPIHDYGTNVSLQKTMKIKANRSKIVLDYALEVEKQKPVSKVMSKAKFATEINLASLGDSAFEKMFGKPSSLSKIRNAEFNYPELGVTISLAFDKAISAWLLPVRSVSQSESGLESNFQGLSVIPYIDFETYLASSYTRFRISLSIKKTN